MASPPVPRIEERWVCIATEKQVALAAVVASYFQDEGAYLAVFEFPPIDVPSSPVNETGTDGYFARLMGDRAAHSIANVLAGIQPPGILLLGMTETERSYFRARLPAGKLFEIDSIAELPRQLPFAQPDSGSIACKPSQIIEGFLLAKFSRKRLVIDEGAADLPAKYLHGGRGVVVIENDGGLPEIAAVNYAFAINADVILTPFFSRQELHALPRQLHSWSNDRSSQALAAVRRKVMKAIAGVNFAEYGLATFFTIGVPYGLFIRNAIPCSHVLMNWHCGVFVAMAIVEEHKPLSFDSALLFSPQEFDAEETGRISAILDVGNYTVKHLLGRDATLKQLENYGGFFPYDVMHICSHGGETEGYYVVQEFADREGGQHKIEFYEVIGASPANGDMVSVTSKMIFTALDGFPWASQPLKHFPRYVGEDMMNAIHSDRSVKRVAFNYPIALSCHIKCHDGIHQGQFQSLAALSHPVVFNNTCSSSHELAASFIGAGARTYIGTLWNVGNATATQAAEVFYKSAIGPGNILAAFTAMNGSLKNRKYQDVYILWGRPFSSLRPPEKKSDEKILNRLVETYFLWLRKIATTPLEEVKRNSIPIARFLFTEILKRFSKERLEEIRELDPNELDEHERSLGAMSGDEIAGNVREIEVSAEKSASRRAAGKPGVS
jgi:hypothetical protein